MQHVHALMALARLLALCTHKFNTSCRKTRTPRARVDHLDQPRVEVDLRRQSRDRHERRGSDRQDRRHRLVEEALIAVRGFLQDQDVPAGALRRADLHSKRVSTCSLGPRTRIYRSDTSSVFVVVFLVYFIKFMGYQDMFCIYIHLDLTYGMCISFQESGSGCTYCI